ncbi:MAG: hypothetical protein U0270_16190 [Labilithrix sp.]
MHIHELLPLGARPAIENALKQPLSYTARYLVTPGAKPRAVVILGEAHIKMGTAAKLGKEVVSKFELRGVESFQMKDVFGGRVLGILINAPRLLLRVLSAGAVKGSTIVEAKAIETGSTVLLEKTEHIPLALHVASVYMSAFFATIYGTFLLGLFGVVVPWLAGAAFLFQAHMVLLLPAWFLRAESWHWVLHPMIAILTVRDTLMVEGTVRMMKDHPGPDAAVLVMGRAHVRGVERQLIEKHGFLPAEL